MDCLVNWVKAANEPLQSYATGLLAASMQLPDIVADNRETNGELIPILLKRLETLSSASKNERDVNTTLNSSQATPNKRRRISSPSNDCSNSSWVEIKPYMIGSMKIHPLTNAVSQRFIFQYLSALGEYQEFLNHVFENNTMPLILDAINFDFNPDVRLVFEALKYLASLFCHKKFALEFLNHNGMQCLLDVNRRSVAASAVSLCLYYIASHDDIMEKICCLPDHVLCDLVSYLLWLIERSNHDSSRTNSLLFLSLTFSYQIILELFDNQDGLRKVINEISMIDLAETNNSFSEDDINSKRQYARHVCIALKKYFETHLVIKTQSLINSNPQGIADYPNIIRLTNTKIPPYKAINYSYDMIMEHVEALLNIIPFRCKWEPVDKLIQYGGFKLLLQFLSLSCDWSFSGKYVFS